MYFFSLLIITFLVFFNAIPHPFVHDDVVFIVNNPQIGRLNHLADVFSQAPHLPEGSVINIYYRPLLEIFYRLEYRLFGFHAAGFHLVNVLVHSANGLVLLALLCRLQFPMWLAYGVSLLFLIHPVQSEAVDCVAGISNLLMAFFVLLTLYTYVREQYGCSFLFLLAALLTKEQAVMTPLLLVLLDRYRRKTAGQTPKRSYVFYFFLATGGFLWLRSLGSGSHMLGDLFHYHHELRLRLLAIARTLLMYLRLIVAPYDLHYYRNTDILADNSVGFLLLLVLAAALKRLTTRLPTSAPMIMFGVAWFVLALLPVLNIVPLINEYSLIMTAEHFLYLPMVGVVIVVGAIATSGVPLRGSPDGTVGTTEAISLKKITSLRPVDSARNDTKLVFWSMVIILISITIHQNTFWRGEVSLFERMIQFEPHFGRGQMLLARAYRAQGQTDLAIAHYRQALAIMEGYQQKAADNKAKRYYQGLIKTMSTELNQLTDSSQSYKTTPPSP